MPVTERIVEVRVTVEPDPTKTLARRIQARKPKSRCVTRTSAAFKMLGGVDGARTRDPRRDRPVF